MLISVVTVCYNAVNTIEQTIESVLSQTYDNIEYIIIDGKSNDGTYQIIEKYERENKNIFSISEKDNGIYDAMNKSIKYIRGEYVFFLNCGDLFYDSAVVSNVVKNLECKHPSLLYGNIDYIFKDHIEHRDYVSRNQLSKLWMAAGITVCHQAVWAKSEILKEKGFDTTYTLWADQEFMAYCMKQKGKIEKYQGTVCKFDAYGFSYGEDKKELSRLECDRISKKYTPIYYALFYPLKKIVRVIEHRKKNI